MIVFDEDAQLLQSGVGSDAHADDTQTQSFRSFDQFDEENVHLLNTFFQLVLGRGGHCVDIFVAPVVVVEEERDVHWTGIEIVVV